jgi:hypothetical protein
MKTNGKYEVNARIAGPRLVLGAVFAMVLSGSSVVRAQSSTTSPAVPAATPAKAALAAQAVQPAAPAKRQPGGTHEGFKVHGLWVIEVKNPDGTVTARREFENSIQPTGAAFLASLMAANNSSAGLSVLLNGAQTSFSNNAFGAIPFTFSEPGPCVPMQFGPGGASTGGPSSGTTCLITTGINNNLTSLVGSICRELQQAYSGSTPANGLTSPCSTDLTISAYTITASSFPSGSSVPTSETQIVLQGSVTATGSGAATSACAAGNICDVETVFAVCSSGETPASCANDVPAAGGTTTVFPVAINFLTEFTLNGPTGSSTAPVAYGPGQTINVQVTISFQ